MSPSHPAEIGTLPDEILLAAESQWLFTNEELLRSPSILAGLAPEREREYRSKGVNFIIQIGIMLKLPQISLATASIFFHRFYMRHLMSDASIPQGYHHYSIAATSLFLATKVEENCRKMKELVIACVRVAQKDPYKIVDEQDKEYWKWKDSILANEDILLESLCFDLRLEAPYKILHDTMLMLGQADNKKLRNAAWAFISDSYLTTFCLLFSSRTITASALYAAARHSNVTFPDNAEGKPWWESLDVSLANIGRACNFMAKAYRGATPKSGADINIHEGRPHEMDGASDPTRQALSTQASTHHMSSEPVETEIKLVTATQSQMKGRRDSNQVHECSTQKQSKPDDDEHEFESILQFHPSNLDGTLPGRIVQAELDHQHSPDTSMNEPTRSTIQASVPPPSRSSIPTPQDGLLSSRL